VRLNVAGRAGGRAGEMRGLAGLAVNPSAAAGTGTASFKPGWAANSRCIPSRQAGAASPTLQPPAHAHLALHQGSRYVLRLWRQALPLVPNVAHLKALHLRQQQAAAGKQGAASSSRQQHSARLQCTLKAGKQT
jgi:hypothetical protein